MLLFDVLRLINLVNAAASVVLAILVVYQAAQARQKPGGPPSLLFWHICAISIGTEGMVVTGATWALTHLGDPPTYWILAYLPFTFIINISLVLILKVQKARFLAQGRLEDLTTLVRKENDDYHGMD